MSSLGSAGGAFSAAKARPPGGRQLAHLVSLAVSAACVWALTTGLDWSAVAGELQRARWPLVLVGALVTLLVLGLRAARWRLLLGGQAPAFRLLLRVYALGVAAGLIVPASGELARAWLLGRGGGPPASFALGTTAIEKLLDTALTLALALLAAALAGQQLALHLPAPPLPVLALAALLLVVLLALVWRRGAGGGAARLALGARIVRFASGLTVLARLRRGEQAAVLLLTVLVWLLACLATLCALAAFDLPSDWRLAAVLYGALLLGLSVPSAPGAVGTFELVCVGVLTALWGQPPTTSAAFAVGFRAMVYVPPLLAGALAALLGGRPPLPAPAAQQGRKAL